MTIQQMSGCDFDVAFYQIFAVNQQGFKLFQKGICRKLKVFCSLVGKNALAVQVEDENSYVYGFGQLLEHGVLNPLCGCVNRKVGADD